MLFTFDEASFSNATATSIPGLWALSTPEGVLCARRGGVWYSPRGTEAEACAAALTTDKLKFTCVDGRVVGEVY